MGYYFSPEIVPLAKKLLSFILSTVVSPNSSFIAMNYLGNLEEISHV